MPKRSSSEQITNIGNVMLDDLSPEELRFLNALRNPELREKIIAILEEP